MKKFPVQFPDIVFLLLKYRPSIPTKTGIQNLLIILDSPVSGTGQAYRRAPLKFLRRMLDGTTKK